MIEDLLAMSCPLEGKEWPSANPIQGWTCRSGWCESLSLSLVSGQASRENRAERLGHQNKFPRFRLSH
jgi:hypothetical protein